MLLQTKLALIAVSALAGAGVLCPLCGGGVRPGDARPVADQAQVPDTAVVRFRIDGMTCGACAATARAALKRLAGVFDATVSYDDALGTVRYDAQKVTPPQIAEHLNRLTGYRATVIADTARAPRRSRP
ncbi:MAG: cation transporter [Gemmatimonadota bacterium]